jgi:5'(3')-deoxyribonucleotidase
MDGVLTDFTKAACKVHGYDGYVPTRFNFFKYEWGMSTMDFWHKIDRTPNFWLELEKFPWTDDLLEYLRKNKHEYTICTSPSLSSSAVFQKVEWMRQHISPHFKDFLIGHQKYLMSNPNHLLIDDYEENCNKHKGPYILFPCSTNRNRHITDPLTYAIDRIEKFYSMEAV